MTLINVEGKEIDVDIQSELEAYDWHRARWTPTKLICASPFRDDSHPSFFVDLESGGWADSGAIEDDMMSGNFAKLMSLLRHEPYEDTVEYLHYVYTTNPYENDFKLQPMTLEEDKKRTDLPDDEFAGYDNYSPYLDKERGIGRATQQLARTKHDADNDAAIMVWRHPDGKLANAKFRKAEGKLFWYHGGHSIGELVYLIDLIYRGGYEEVYLCEAEIDALSLWQVGKPAIAIGNRFVGDVKANLIRKSPIKTLIIVPDNDDAGKEVFVRVWNKLRRYLHIGRLQVPREYKDMNQWLTSEGEEKVRESIDSRLTFDRFAVKLDSDE